MTGGEDLLTRLFGLSGRRALVTGAAGGIGFATARALAGAGADILLADIDGTEDRLEERAAEIADTHGVKTAVAVADVADEAAVDAMIATAVDRLGGLDIVHSNAGTVAGHLPDLDIDYGDWRRNLEVNLHGMFLVGRAAARAMVDQGIRGSIVHTASMSGLIVNDMFDEAAGGSAYATAKAGVIHLTRAQAVQWAPHGIRVNAVSPGYISSGIHDGTPQAMLDHFVRRTPLKRFGEVDEVVGAVLYLAAPAASFTTGANLVVDGGYTCW